MTENENDNTIEIKHDEHEPETYITLVDINIVSEMNSSNRLQITEEPEYTWPNEQYNLRPQPERRVQFALAQTNNQLVMSIPKTHAQRVKKTTQLTSTYPCNREEMSQDERKKFYCIQCS